MSKLIQTLDRRLPLLAAAIRRLTGKKKIEPFRTLIEGDNNTIRHEGARLWDVVFEVYGDNNLIEIGEGCVVKNVRFYIRGRNHRLRIERGVRFHHGAQIWMQDSDGVLTIGENSTFEKVHFAVTEPGSRLTIGKECMFAFDIDVRTGDSHSILDAETGRRINYAQDVSIGDRVWVAAHCLIMKGVQIQDDSIVAGGAVVTRRFDRKGIVIGGNPAKQIKENVTWLRNRIYDS